MSPVEPASLHARRHGEALRAVALKKVPRALVVVAVLAHVVCFAWVLIGRLGYPYELEWMTGSVLDHVERVRAGQPLYVEPSDGFIPFLYPPLYYWVCALLGGSALACRLVSLAALVGQLVAARAIARALGARSFWTWAAPALVLVCFPYVGCWYDIERCDVLASMFAMGGVALLVTATTARGFVAAGILFGLGCLTKQQAFFPALGAGAGAFFATVRRREGTSWRGTILVGVAIGVTVALGLAFAVHREGARLFLYVFEMPRSHGVLASLVKPTLERDVGQGPLLVLLTLAAPALLAFGPGKRTTSELVFGGALVASFVGAVSSRLHIGGWINVLQPWSSFACVGVAVLASRLDERRAGWIVAPLAVLWQLFVWRYDPGSFCPPRASRALVTQMRARIHELEASGEVLTPAQGNVTTPRHFHIAALADVVRMTGHAPQVLVDKLDRRAYAAIVDGARSAEDPAPDPDWPPVYLEDVTGVREHLLRNYYVAEKFDDRTFYMALPTPNLAVWVYRPRAEPLGPEVDLRAQQLREMAIVRAAEKKP